MHCLADVSENNRHKLVLEEIRAGRGSEDKHNASIVA